MSHINIFNLNPIPPKPITTQSLILDANFIYVQVHLLRRLNNIYSMNRARRTRPVATKALTAEATGLTPALIEKVQSTPSLWNSEFRFEINDSCALRISSSVQTSAMQAGTFTILSNSD